jgi:hypothetical protein
MDGDFFFKDRVRVPAYIPGVFLCRGLPLRPMRREQPSTTHRRGRGSVGSTGDRVATDLVGAGLAVD